MGESEATARKFDRCLLAIGAALAVGGIYFMLVGIGAVPAPSKLYGPNWIALAVGVVFTATGLSVLVRGWLGLPDTQTRLPDTAPAAAAVQWLASLTVIVGLATIGTWVALGSGERSLTMMLPVKGTLGETAGRVAFGIAALITWLIGGAMAYDGVKSFLRKNPDQPPAE